MLISVIRQNKTAFGLAQKLACYWPGQPLRIWSGWKGGSWVTDGWLDPVQPPAAAHRWVQSIAQAAKLPLVKSNAVQGFRLAAG